MLTYIFLIFFLFLIPLLVILGFNYIIERLIKKIKVYPKYEKGDMVLFYFPKSLPVFKMTGTVYYISKVNNTFRYGIFANDNNSTYYILNEEDIEKLINRK